MADGPSMPMPGAATTRGICLLTTRLPEVPVTVKPVGLWTAEAVAFKVSVDVAGEDVPGVEIAEKEAVTPAGKPDADKLTLPANPFSGLIVMVVVTVLPGFNSKEAGVLDKVNVGP